MGSIRIRKQSIARQSNIGAGKIMSVKTYWCMKMTPASLSKFSELFKNERIKPGACGQYLNNTTKIHPLLKPAYASEYDESSS
jgi:hypothetical protein